MMRIGHGYDIHRLVPGKKLMLGGIRMPYEKGFVAHSDGDVVLHALCDALLGAASLGDMGQHFPDSDPKWKDTPSAVFLKQVLVWVRQKHWQVANVDVTILAEAPKLAPYMKDMCTKVADIMQISLSCINIKAKTAEGLGVIGQHHAIAAYAVALLVQ